MEKIDRNALKKWEWREEVMDKLDEIVDWINEREATLYGSRIRTARSH